MGVEALREIACSMYPVDSPEICCDSLPFGLRAISDRTGKETAPDQRDYVACEAVTAQR